MIPSRSTHSAAIGPGLIVELAHPTPVSADQAPKRNVPLAPANGAEAFVVNHEATAPGEPRKHTQ